jgi:hypothetical protein
MSTEMTDAQMYEEIIIKQKMLIKSLESKSTQQEKNYQEMLDEVKKLRENTPKPTLVETTYVSECKMEESNETSSVSVSAMEELFENIYEYASESSSEASSEASKTPLETPTETPSESNEKDEFTVFADTIKLIQKTSENILQNSVEIFGYYDIEIIKRFLTNMITESDDLIVLCQNMQNNKWLLKSLLEHRTRSIVENNLLNNFTDDNIKGFLKRNFMITVKGFRELKQENTQLIHDMYVEFILKHSKTLYGNMKCDEYIKEIKDINYFRQLLSKLNAIKAGIIDEEVKRIHEDVVKYYHLKDKSYEEYVNSLSVVHVMYDKKQISYTEYIAYRQNIYYNKIYKIIYNKKSN